MPMKRTRAIMMIAIVLVALVSTELLLLISYRGASNSVFAQLEANDSIVAE